MKSRSRCAGPGAGPTCCSKSAAPSTTARSAPASGSASKPPTIRIRQQPSRHDPQSRDSRLPPRFPPASKPKPRIHPRSENERGNTRPPSHPQSRDGPVTSGAVPDLFQNNPTEISALYAWEDKLVDVINVIDTQRNQFT